MKCEVCLTLLERYVDGELVEADSAAIGAHLITCEGCAEAFDSLLAEQEFYSRYDRELSPSPGLWNAIAAQTVNVVVAVEPRSKFSLREWFAINVQRWGFASAVAVVVLAVAVGSAYLRKSQPTTNLVALSQPEVKFVEAPRVDRIQPRPPVSERLAKPHKPTVQRAVQQVATKSVSTDQSDVLFSDVASSAAEEKETQTHLENAQNLLRSVRNIEVGDDGEVDVSYEKGLSRQLLNENVVLRREAEMSGKFPTKDLLTDLEPFLIDIANLPDKPAREDLRALKNRVLKTEIVAALQGY
jgi:putative zinc finger protein